jgi:hypothetical protein
MFQTTALPAELSNTGVICSAVVLLLLGSGALVLGFFGLREDRRLRIKVFGFCLETGPGIRRFDDRAGVDY